MKKIDDFVNGIHSVAVSGHIRPDGDCIGSVLALYRYLHVNYPNLHVDMYLESPLVKYSFLKGFDMIRNSLPDDYSGHYDLMICLDCSTLDRLGFAQKVFHDSDHTVCIDHHISNPGYADENYIEPDSSSASEVLYGFLEKEKTDAETAKCLYVGIVSDTGVFRYSSTSPETMRIAAGLMEYGLDTNYLVDESFSSKSFDESRILGYALQKCRQTADGSVIYSYITKDEMDLFHVTDQNLDGIVEQMRNVRGTVCSLFLYETGKYEYKASLRSVSPFNVNEVAEYFGGGGHIRAAGCTVRGELETCLEAILMRIIELKEN